LRMVGRDCDVCLRRCDKPEFDAWRWNQYWIPLDNVVEFKRDVYFQALSELSRYLPAVAAVRPEAPTAGLESLPADAQARAADPESPAADKDLA
jgi:hypothetical protein